MNSRNLAAIATVLALSIGITPAQGDPAALAVNYSKSLKNNTTSLKQYSWKSSTVVERKGKKEATRLTQIRFDSRGVMERTPMGGETTARKKRGLRGRVQKKKQAKAKDFIGSVSKLVASYTIPSTGTLVDFFDRATFTKTKSGEANVQIKGNKFNKPGDMVTMWVNTERQLPEKLKIRTWVGDNDDRTNIDATIHYGALKDGTAFPVRSVIVISTKDLRLTTEQFDHIKQGG